MQVIVESRHPDGSELREQAVAQHACSLRCADSARWCHGPRYSFPTSTAPGEESTNVASWPKA